MSRVTTQALREGRKRMEFLLPGILAELAPRVAVLTQEEFRSGLEVSPVGASLRPHVRVKNLGALTLTRVRPGGWTVEIVLDNMPIGMPDTLGTPPDKPYRTRPEALAAARQLLEGIAYIALALGRFEPDAPTTGPVFLLFGKPVPLQTEVLESLNRETPYGGRCGFRTEREATESMDLLWSDLFPDSLDSFEAEHLASLPKDRVTELGVAMHMAALVGVMQHPNVEPMVFADA